MDMSGDGLHFENLWAGPGLSFGSSLILLCFDNFLYAVLAYYLDLVIPSEFSVWNCYSSCFPLKKLILIFFSGEYGAKKEPWFFLNPVFSLWKFIFRKETVSFTGWNVVGLCWYILKKKVSEFIVLIFAQNVTPRTYATSDNVNNNDIEPVCNNLKEKVGIEIVNLYKSYSSCRGANVNAVNGETDLITYFRLKFSSLFA